jgi:T5SS/PEP-CTERM-associated repeat protein
VETSGDARIGNLGADGTVTLDTAGSPDPENLYSQWVVRDINVGSVGTGRLSILNGSKITSRNSVIGDTAGLNTGNVAVSGSGSKWTSTGPLTVASTGTLALADDAVVEAAGNVVVDSSGAIQGQGTIVGDVTNGGAVVPGGTLIDTLVIDGDYAQAAAGVLAFELASSMSNQKLSVTGSVALDGTLQVTLADGFIPALNDSFDLLDWGELPGQLAGAFAAVQLPPLAAGLSWSSTELYTLGQLKVVVGPAGDYNSNGVVDAADYVIWREEIETPEAYDVWKANFGKTVAGSGASHGGRLFGSAAGEAVPEPASIVLVLFCTSVLLRFRRRAKRQNTRLGLPADKTLPEIGDVG